MPNNDRSNSRSGGLLNVTPRDRAQTDRYLQPPENGEPISDADVPDFIRRSWRWNDPQAIQYELDRAREKRDTARRIRGAAGAGSTVGWLKGAYDIARKGQAVAGAPGLLAGAALEGGLQMAERDEIYFGRRARALEQRHAVLSGR